jgi:SHS2 domain-containing protein
MPPIGKSRRGSAWAFGSQSAGFAMYETFEHTADLGLRVRAPNPPELFAEAGRGLFSLIVTNLDDVRPAEQVAVEIEGTQLDYLLFDWLNELLFLFECRHLLLSQFDVRIDAAGLKATARGETADPARHELDHEVKAITYHGLKVAQEDNGWLAEIIVDI